MIASSVASLPSSRDIAGLWREVPLPRPQALWIGHLRLHHLDVPVLLRIQEALDPLTTGLLGAVRLCQPATLIDLEQRLGLGMPLVGNLLPQLLARGLVERAGSHGWQLSAIGAKALDEGAVERETVTRWSFFFWDRGAQVSPEFLAVPPGLSHPLQDPGPWAFPPTALAQCVSQPRDWKAQHGFPLDVVERRRGPSPDDLILDRAEALPVVIMGVEPSLLRALDARWKLLPGPPLRTFATLDVLMDSVGLSPLPPDEPSARTPWSAWARKRGVTDRDIAACGLCVSGITLRVTAAEAVWRRLQKVAWEDDGWVLTGEGPLRRALQLQLARA